MLYENQGISWGIDTYNAKNWFNLLWVFPESEFPSVLSIVTRPIYSNFLFDISMTTLYRAIIHLSLTWSIFRVPILRLYLTLRVLYPGLVDQAGELAFPPPKIFAIFLSVSSSVVWLKSRLCGAEVQDIFNGSHSFCMVDERLASSKQSGSPMETFYWQTAGH